MQVAGRKGMGFTCSLSIFCLPSPSKIFFMGRGDKKTKKGKIFKGSFGKSRPARPAQAKKAAAAEKKA
jgi:30S ribosomal protein S31